MIAGLVVWPGTNFNGRTCSVTAGTPIVHCTGNLAEDLGSSDPGAAGWGFLGPDDRLYCITSSIDFDQASNTTTFAIHRNYAGASVASGGRFDVVPFQGLSASAAVQLAKLVQYYTPTIRATSFPNIASLPAANKVGQLAWVEDGTGLVVSDGTSWQPFGTATSGGDSAPPRTSTGRQRTVLSTVAETAITPADADNFLDLFSLRLANSSAAAVLIDIRDAMGGTVVDTIALPAGLTFGFHGSPSGALPQYAKNNSWTAQSSGAGITVSTFFVKRAT